MTIFNPNITLYGYHRDGTESKVHTYTPEHQLDSDCAETAIANASKFVAEWVGKWTGMSNSPDKFRAELYFVAEFPDGRKAQKLKDSGKLRSAEKVTAYVDRHTTKIFRKFAQLA